VVAVDAGDVEAGNALFNQQIENLGGEQVAVGLQHHLGAALVFLLNGVENEVKLGAVGHGLATGEDEPVDAIGQVAHDAQAILRADAGALRAGAVVAMVALIVAKLGEHPIDGFAVIEIGFHLW